MKQIDGIPIALLDARYAALAHLHAGVYEPVDATIVRTGDANWIDLTDGGGTTLHTHAGYEPTIAAGTTAQFWRGDKAWSDTLLGALTISHASAPTITSSNTAAAASVASFKAFANATNYPRASFDVGLNASDNNAGLYFQPTYGTNAATKPMFLFIQTVKDASVASTNNKIIGVYQSSTQASIAAVGVTGNAAGTPLHFSTQKYDGTNSGLIINNDASQLITIGTNTIQTIAQVQIRPRAAGLYALDVLGNTTQSLPVARLRSNDTTNNAVREVLQLLSINSTASTGGANGFGAAQTFYAETATDATYQQQAQIAGIWVDATDATRKAKLQLSAYDTAQRIGLEIEASGSAPMIGFFGVQAVARATELTDELTTITHTAPGTPDYAIQDLTDTGGFGFVTKDEGNSVLAVIANLQTRVNELETKLTAYGLLQDVD